MLQPQVLTAKAASYPGLNVAGIEGTVLATIVNKKCCDVEKIDVTKLPKREVSHRSLFKALKGGSGRSFILECKKSSPTLGDFCKDFNLDRLIDCYERHAAAVSVLCEEHFFKGSLEYLKHVRAHTSLPVICKDFIICREQLEAANSAGADAVLLMLSLLTHERFTELYDHARSLGLEVLCEVDSEDDARFAASHKLPIIGINNRDLRILKIDLQNAKRLSALLPKDCAIVSESGINSYADLRSLSPIKSFLIGSSLSGSKNVYFAANSMLYGLNKVCGIRDEASLDAAIAGHASIAGLIFAKKSPRALDPETAALLVKHGHPYIDFAAVFVDEDLDEMVRIVKKTDVDYIQLHGHESAELIAALRRELPGVKIIKALCIKGNDDFKAYLKYEKICDLMLLDSGSPGSGTSFAWGEIPAYIDKTKALLSGGIGIDNIHKALEQGFCGLDMNSQLECEKGIKDPALIKKALDIIKEYIH